MQYIGENYYDIPAMLLRIACLFGESSKSARTKDDTSFPVKLENFLDGSQSARSVSEPSRIERSAANRPQLGTTRSKLMSLLSSDPWWSGSLLENPESWIGNNDRTR